MREDEGMYVMHSWACLVNTHNILHLTMSELSVLLEPDPNLIYDSKSLEVPVGNKWHSETD